MLESKYSGQTVEIPESAVLENNPRAGSFEFGVVAITEIGKKRGNNLELKEVRKGADDTNQKNDLFNSWLKMCRHSATVDIFFVQEEKTWQLIQEN